VQRYPGIQHPVAIAVPVFIYRGLTMPVHTDHLYTPSFQNIDYIIKRVAVQILPLVFGLTGVTKNTAQVTPGRKLDMRSLRAGRNKEIGDSTHVPFGKQVIFYICQPFHSKPRKISLSGQ
jgi:hypothetical protein